MKYRLTKSAEKDLVDIWNYTTKEWSEAQAEFYLNQLDARFLLLAENPMLGRVRKELWEGVYSLGSGQHIIFYRYSQGRVEILRVLHASRDVSIHLPSEEV